MIGRWIFLRIRGKKSSVFWEVVKPPAKKGSVIPVFLASVYDPTSSALLREPVNAMGRMTGLGFTLLPLCLGIDFFHELGWPGRTNHNFRYFEMVHPQKLTYPLNNAGWKTIFLLKRSLFRWHVIFREGTPISFDLVNLRWFVWTQHSGIW